MSDHSAFWGELRSPSGVLFEIETRSLRELMFSIRFLAVTQSAKLVARGFIPPDSAPCARCDDLIIREATDPEVLCPDCRDIDGP